MPTFSLPRVAEMPPWAPLAQVEDSFWLPPAGSTLAPAVDDLFHFLLTVSAFFFVLIVTLMVVFVCRYRRRPGVGPAASPSHNTLLEIVWTSIPVLIVIYVFYAGFTGFMELRTSPREAREIRVVARQFQWIFQYPTGHVDEQLHIPVDEPVRLVMRSDDVIHGFYVPDFRAQMDVVPGRYTTVWFRAREPGEHDLLCTQYCGTGHSNMFTKVVVHPPGEYEKWLAGAGNEYKNMPPVEAGKLLYARKGCAQCHSVDGKAGTGPSFKGIYGERVLLIGGESLVVDENYLRESIVDPQAKIVQGYQPVMQTYRGILSDDEITNIIEYIKSLKYLSGSGNGSGQ